MLKATLVSGLLSPVEKRDTKYSGHGGYSVKSFKSYGLPPSIVLTLIEAANHSVSHNTWKSYKTAERHIKRCETETGVKLRLPFGVKETLTYIAWLRRDRKVKSTTVDKYLSGIRMVHLRHGHAVPALRPDIVRAVFWMEPLSRTVCRRSWRGKLQEWRSPWR